MKYWLQRLSFWLAISSGVAVAAELAWVEIERRRGSRLTLQWRQQLQQLEKLAQATPALTSQNEQAMADEVLRLQREVAVLRAELFPETENWAPDAGSGERVDAYFDVAALVGRLRVAAAAADVIVKPTEHFGFSAYAQDAPTAADLARVREQCFVAETLLNCLFSARPRELVAVKREPIDSGAAAGSRQQPDYFVLERGLSLRAEQASESIAIRVEFSGETASLRRFLQALAHAAKLLVVRSVEAVPAGGGISEQAGSKESTSELVAREVISRFTVTVEAVRPAKAPGAPKP